jgi:hypothetical protein
MDARQQDYPQSGLSSPYPTFPEPLSEGLSADQASAAQYPPQGQDPRASNLTPTSDYSLNPSSARSGSFPEYIQRSYQPGAQGQAPGGMAQQQSPSMPLSDGQSNDHHQQQQHKSDSDVPIGNEPYIPTPSAILALHTASRYAALPGPASPDSNLWPATRVGWAIPATRHALPPRLVRSARTCHGLSRAATANSKFSEFFFIWSHFAERERDAFDRYRVPVARRVCGGLAFVFNTTLEPELTLLAGRTSAFHSLLLRTDSRRATT